MAEPHYGNAETDYRSTRAFAFNIPVIRASRFQASSSADCPTQSRTGPDGLVDIFHEGDTTFDQMNGLTPQGGLQPVGHIVSTCCVAMLTLRQCHEMKFSSLIGQIVELQK